MNSAHGWREVLDPVVARYRGRGLRCLLRGDAAFALPDVYEYLEADYFQYAIRLPANQVLQSRELTCSRARWVGHRITCGASTRASATVRRVGAPRIRLWRRRSRIPASCCRASASS